MLIACRVPLAGDRPVEVPPGMAERALKDHSTMHFRTHRARGYIRIGSATKKVGRAVRRTEPNRARP